MLRITKKERALINSQNARARKKANKLKTLYGMTDLIKIKTPKQFTSRSELNEYKKELKHFNFRYTHNYVQGGKTYHGKDVVYFPIPTREWNSLKRKYKQMENYAKNRYEHSKQIKTARAGKIETSYYTGEDRTLHEKITFYKASKQHRGFNTKYKTYYPEYLDPSKIHSKKELQKVKTIVKEIETVKKSKLKQRTFIDNYCEALYNTFGSNADRIINLISLLTPSEFEDLYYSDEDMQFDYIYDPEQALKILKTITNAVESFIFRQNLQEQKRFSNNLLLDEALEVRELDPAILLSEYSSHTIKINGLTYTLSTKELEEYHKTGKIPDRILKLVKELEKF